MNYLIDIPDKLIEKEGINHKSIYLKIGRIKSIKKNLDDKLLTLYKELGLSREERERHGLIPTVNDVVHNVITYYGLSEYELTKKGRANKIAPIRFVTMYLIRKITGSSYQVIGYRLNRDHATALYGVKQFNALSWQGEFKWMEHDALEIEKLINKKYE